MKDAQWVRANEEVNENDEVATIDEQHQDVNALQEKLKYIHVFFDKNFQCTDKDGNKKMTLKQKKKNCTMFQKLKKNNYLASRSRRQRRRSPSTLQERK